MITYEANTDCYTYGDNIKTIRSSIHIIFHVHIHSQCKEFKTKVFLWMHASLSLATVVLTKNLCKK